MDDGLRIQHMPWESSNQPDQFSTSSRSGALKIVLSPLGNEGRNVGLGGLSDSHHGHKHQHIPVADDV